MKQKTHQKMIIQEVPVKSLKKTTTLKRKHSREQIDRCVHSLLKFGQYTPIVVSENEILCGNMVYDAVKRLKWKKIKIVQLGKLDEEKKRELRYLDNRTFDMSFWKEEELKMFLMTLDNEIVENCGFKDEEVEKLINGFYEDAKETAREISKKQQTPQVWKCKNCNWEGTIE